MSLKKVIGRTLDTIDGTAKRKKAEKDRLLKWRPADTSRKNGSTGNGYKISKKSSNGVGVGY